MWQKMRVNQGQEFVIGGYTASAKNFDALIFGYYKDTRLLYAARTEWFYAGITRKAVPAIQGNGDQPVPVCKSSGG